MNASFPSGSSSSRWAVGLVIAPFFLWGTAMVAMKGAMVHTTPWLMAGLRLVPAGLLVLVAAMVMGRPFPKTWRAWAWIALFAFVDGLMFQGFLAAGLTRTGAGLGSVMIDSQPLAVALLSHWLFGEVIGPWGVLGLMFGLLGIALIGVPDNLIWGLWQPASSPIAWSWTAIAHSGELLMLCASLSMALGTILIRYVCRHVDPVQATGWHMVLGGLPLLGWGLVGGSDPWGQLTWSDGLAIAYATLFGSAIAYGIFFYLAAERNLTSLSALTFLTPVFALLFGNLLLGEVLSLLQWVGVFLTLISIYLINQREKLSETLNSWRSSLLPSGPQTSLPLDAIENPEK